MNGHSSGRAWSRPGRLAALVLALLPFGGAVTTAQSDPSIFVVNKASLTIRYIYVSPGNTTDWGRDWLGNKVLAPGQRFRVAPPRGGQCMFDVRVVYSNNQSEERRQQNLCTIQELTFTGTPPASDNADFFVVNQSRKTIMRVYVSVLQSENWGQDRLPATIVPGARFAVHLPRGECNYDVRIVYEDT